MKTVSVVLAVMVTMGVFALGCETKQPEQKQEAPAAEKAPAKKKKPAYGC